MSEFTNITSAQLIRYNANSSGRSTGDCVKRALSLAFNVPYTEMAKELIAKMKELRQDAWNIHYVYEPVIKAHGGSNFAKLPQPCGTLAEFADGIGHSGTWLVCTGSKPNSENHIVCVIDGVIYDSWDSSNEYAISYASAPSVKREFTSLCINDYRDEIDATLKETTKKLLKKYPWEKYIESLRANVSWNKNNNYRMIVDFNVVLGDRPYRSDASYYNSRFYIIFTPSTTDEEAHKIIKQTIQTRVYDRLYSINQQEKKFEAFHAEGGVRRPAYMDAREVRFWNTLPAKQQAIIKYIRIERPGQYSDSYQVEVNPQWNEGKSVWLETYEADEMRWLLTRYMEDGTTYYDG